jgi:periplasmic protein TonB
MGTQALTLPEERRDSLGAMVLVSAILHAVLLGVAVSYTLLGFRFGSKGNEWGTQDSARMGAVASLPGIPLPTPVVQTPTTVVTQNPTPAPVPVQEPPKPEPPPPDAQQIPKFKEAVPLEKVERINKHIPQPNVPPPDNAVPGQGEATMNYTQTVTQGGAIGVSAGEGNSFGQRYAWYVASMRMRISGNWLLTPISPSVTSAPRVMMTFVIQRNGSITEVEITQSSGVPEVDRSALRAILASSPLPPLPADYAGGSVNVQFYFDFHRQ